MTTHTLPPLPYAYDVSVLSHLPYITQLTSPGPRARDLQADHGAAPSKASPDLR